uniref:Uncharacterized protein n=1 Tax=Laurencieae sp. TaxID=2007162 RepID=A0A1Z1M287_9FLOR|nr:hypothetical protein [Laurencieae sp.]
MTSNLKNIYFDRYNENSSNDSTETYLYNYNTEDVELSNNSSYMCLNETIDYYTECNRKILNSETD